MKGRVLFATVAAVVAAGGTASAAGERSARHPDLSSGAAINRYLASTGVDPFTVVRQHGMRNYAGPNCPGRGWTCTTSSRAVQDGPAAAQNVFECAEATCTVVQTDATNRARCRQRTGTAQSCTITQSGQDNDAGVDQRVHQRDGSSQVATQKASVDQQAGGAGNSARIKQTVDQDVHANGKDDAIDQSQLADQDVAVQQNGTLGADNASDVDQTIKQRARADTKAGAITQSQQADDADTSTPAQTHADVDQESDTGTNTSRLGQLHDLDAHAKAKTGDVTQTQGDEDGGLDAGVNQDSLGLSTSDNDQKERQKLHGKTDGTLAQTQTGPQSCCSDQFSNPGNTFNINQTSDQKSNSNDPGCIGCSQQTFLGGTANTSGQFTITHAASNDDDDTQQQSTGTGFGSLFTSCQEGDGGTECSTEEGGGPDIASPIGLARLG